MQGSLGWLLLLDAADRAQSNSVPAPCVVCFLTEAILSVLAHPLRYYRYSLYFKNNAPI
jgi:hypothetical protein